MNLRTFALYVAFYFWIAVALFVLPGCTSPFGQTTDQFRIAQGYAMQGQMAAQQQASLNVAGRQLRRLAPMSMTPLIPLAPLSPLAR